MRVRVRVPEVERRLREERVPRALRAEHARDAGALVLRMHRLVDGRERGERRDVRGGRVLPEVDVEPVGVRRAAADGAHTHASADGLQAVQVVRVAAGDARPFCVHGHAAHARGPGVVVSLA